MCPHQVHRYGHTFVVCTYCLGPLVIYKKGQQCIRMWYVFSNRIKQNVRIELLQEKTRVLIPSVEHLVDNPNDRFKGNIGGNIDRFENTKKEVF